MNKILKVYLWGMPVWCVLIVFLGMMRPFADDELWWMASVLLPFVSGAVLLRKVRRPAIFSIIFAVIWLLITSILAFLATMEWGGVTRDGYRLRRVGPAAIRLSWGTGSGVMIGPYSKLYTQGFILKTFQDDPLVALPTLAPYDGVWMYVVDPESSTAQYVNPKLSDAENRIFQIMELEHGGGDNKEIVTRLAAQSYIYLGWVVMGEKDVAALKKALADRSKVDLDADLITTHGTLYRLRPGVEKHFVGDVQDEAALLEARKRIPIMFESMNRKAGHPCDTMHVLYLDGHIEVIPFSKRFPAVQGFMDAFPPPALDLPREK